MKPEELAYNGAYLTPESAIKWMLAGNKCKDELGKEYYFKTVSFVRKHNDDEEYPVSVFKELKPILPGHNEQIKAEHEQALKNGKIVKLFCKWKRKELSQRWDECQTISDSGNLEYKLIYYRIDLSKLLSWSYSFGEGKEKWIKCGIHSWLDSTFCGVLPEPLITNMKLTVYNKETNKEELVDIPDSCLVEIEKDF